MRRVSEATLSHLVILQHALELVVRREAHTGLEGVTDNDGVDARVQPAHAALLQRLLEERDGRDRLGECQR